MKAGFFIGQTGTEPLRSTSAVGSAYCSPGRKPGDHEPKGNKARFSGHNPSPPHPSSSYNADVNIELKGLSREQVTNLLPEGLISLCWRGSVAHGMYVPKSDPDSIDDKDVMGVYIAPIEHYLGFGRRDVFEKWEGEWDCVFYELRKFIELLLNCNPNVLSLLWLKPNGME